MMHVFLNEKRLLAAVAVFATGVASAAINARSYVPGGLVAQYDGIDNVGFGQHSDDTATWVDLTGNGNDATKAANVTWAANGWQNAADCKPMIVASRGMAEVTATKTFTMEFATTPSRHAVRQCFFGQYDKKGFSIEQNSSSSNTKNGFLRLYYNLNSASAMSEEFIYASQTSGEWASVSVASDVARQAVRKNGGVANTMDKTIGGTMTDDCDSVIGGDNSRTAMAFRGTYHAFRLYDRVLTDREAAINAAVDAVRFNGADWSDCPKLAAYSFDASGNLQKSLLAVAGEGGSVKIGDGAAASSAATESVAFSTAGGQTATFTAVPEPGYVLYRWEGDTDAITSGSVVAPTVTASSAQGARLVAVFRKRGLTALSYVQDGLVALYDGIENTGVGQHSDNASTWVDLTGNGNDGACANELSWSDCGWSVSGGCKPVTVASTQLSKTLSTGVFSIQFACTPQTPRDSSKRMCYFGQYSGVAGDVNVEKTADNQVRLYRNTMLGATYDWKSSGKTYMPAGSFASVSYAMSTNAGALYVGGDKKETKMADFITSRTNTTSIIGGEVNRPNFAFSGTYNAFRLYNRVLTAEEMKLNAMIDDARFNGGANLPAGYSTGDGMLLASLSAAATTGGKVSLRGGAAAPSVSAGMDVLGSDYAYLEAIPEAGYIFDRWTGDTDAIIEGHAVSARIAIEPSKPVTLTAAFRKPGNALDGMILDLDIRDVQDNQLMTANLKNVGDALKAGSSSSDRAYTCWYSQPSGFADSIPMFKVRDIAPPMTPFTTNAAQPCIYLTQKVNENGVCGVTRWELPYDYVPPPVATIYTRFFWEGRVTNSVANDCCIVCNGYDSYGTQNQGFVLRLRTSTSEDKGFFNVFMPGCVPSVDTSGDSITAGSWVDCFVSVYPSPTDARRSNADIWFCQTPSQASSGIFNQPQLKHKYMGDECGLPRFTKVADGHAMRLGAESSGATDSYDNKRKAFRGYYAALKAWNRVLTENEMWSVMSGRYGGTFNVGVENGSADEFGGSWYGTADPFDVAADKWQAMKKSLTAADRTLTLTVPIPEESNRLPRVLEIVPLFDGVGEACPVKITANGIDVGTFDLMDEAKRAIVLRGGHSRNGANGRLTIAITRPEGCTGTLSFDAISLAGSWQIGADDNTSTDMTQQAQGITSVFIAGDPVAKHAQRGLTTTYNTLAIPFDVPKASAGQCAYRYEADLHDFKAGNTHPLHLELNGETVWSSENAMPGKVTVELAAESILPGLNELKWVYGTTTANNWMTFDYHRMKMVPPSLGTALMVR